MYQIAICPSNTDANLSLTFKTRESAEHARQVIFKAKENETDLSIKDDYGYILSINGMDIAYCLFSSVEEAQRGTHDRQLALAVANEKIFKEAANNPETRRFLNVPQPPESKLVM